MMNYTSGTTWNDLTSNANNFTFSGTPTVTNQGTSTAYWSLANGVFATAAGAILPAGGSYTKGIVLFVDSNGYGTGNVLSSQNGVDAFYFDGGPNIQAGNGANWNSVFSTESISTGTWHYINLVFSTSTGFTIYIDGTAAGTNSNTTPIAAASIPQIGAFLNSYNFPGRVAAAHEYTRALSPTEILQNYNYYMTRYNGATPS